MVFACPWPKHPASHVVTFLSSVTAVARHRLQLTLHCTLLVVAKRQRTLSRTSAFFHQSLWSSSWPLKRYEGCFNADGIDWRPSCFLFKEIEFPSLRSLKRCRHNNCAVPFASTLDTAAVALHCISAISTSPASSSFVLNSSSCDSAHRSVTCSRPASRVRVER